MPTALVLNALLGASRAYGIEILEATGLKSGTLYPVLRRLEAAGWVESEWEATVASELGRPRRRHYWLTGLGANRAHVEVGKLRQALSGTSRPALGLEMT